MRKWYFSMNERSDAAYERLAKAAVVSCLQNTSLAPHCLYDGAANAFTQWLEQRGVALCFHRAEFLDPLFEAAQSNEAYRNMARGAFLRVEIPLVERHERFILYTDVDILFLADVSPFPILPKVFACAPQFLPTDYSYFNSGVMVMNVEAMRAEYRGFIRFIRERFSTLEAFDQGALNLYFANRWERLPTLYNWKPYWGEYSQAKIVHFHGPKPEMIEQWLRGDASELSPLIQSLLKMNPAGMAAYLKTYRTYASQT